MAVDGDLRTEIARLIKWIIGTVVTTAGGTATIAGGVVTSSR